jgi:hypothetical protein
MPEQTSQREPHELYPDEAGKKAPAGSPSTQTKDPDRPAINKDREKRPERTEN